MAKHWIPNTLSLMGGCPSAQARCQESEFGTRRTRLSFSALVIRIRIGIRVRDLLDSKNLYLVR